MPWSNYHCHSDFCDGAGDISSYAEAALDRGFAALGLSSHAPLPFRASWCLGGDEDPGALSRYRNAVDELKAAFAGELAIIAGLEVDYIPGLVGPAQPVFAGFDYRIGSVHFVGSSEGGSPWRMDQTAESFASGLDEIFGGDIRALARAYYARLSAMVLYGGVDIVGHLDLVKKFNRGETYFREDEAWYRCLVERSLAIIASSGSVVEVNTSGMARGHIDEPYPSPWIIARCVQLEIPLCLSSDCRHPRDVDFAFADTALDLAWAGCESLAVLDEGGWGRESIDARGPSGRARVD
ncbi:MAG: histidinol-phosphatase [Spirochaetaceae bacterium]|nr:histidinol-phosphatase [Spirochaetaceae bacterium]